jgi:hypothetical protein
LVENYKKERDFFFGILNFEGQVTDKSRPKPFLCLKSTIFVYNNLRNLHGAGLFSREHYVHMSIEIIFLKSRMNGSCKQQILFL